MNDDELLLACVQRKLDAAGWLDFAARLAARPELAAELAELEALAASWREETAAAEAAVVLPAGLTRRMLGGAHAVMRAEAAAASPASPLAAGWAGIRRSLAPLSETMGILQKAWKMALAPLALADEPAVARKRLREQQTGG